MKEPTWAALRDDIIIPIGNDLISSFPDLQWLPVKDREADWDRLLHTQYDQNRVSIRGLMRSSGEEIRLDRHKICAAITAAIIEVSPLIPKRPKEASEGARYANESLALEVSISILKSFCIKDAEDTDDMGLASIMEQDFIFPQPSEKTYDHHFIKALFHAKKAKKVDFSIYANLMFTLESYHIHHHLLASGVV